MKIIMISSLGCPSCIIMNKIINEIKKEKSLLIEELDFDFDDVSEYNPGNIMPVLMFFDENGKEYKRLIGENKKEEIIKYIR